MTYFCSERERPEIKACTVLGRFSMSFVEKLQGSQACMWKHTQSLSRKQLLHSIQECLYEPVLGAQGLCEDTIVSGCSLTRPRLQG